MAWLPITLVSPRTLIASPIAGFAADWLSRSQSSVGGWLQTHGYMEPDLLWIDSVIWEEVADLARPRKSVLRLADLNRGFPKHQIVFDAMEERIAKRVDLTVYTASGLLPHVKALGPRRSEQMLNGVDLARFANATDEPLDIQSIPAPRAVYVGAIDDWFDFDLIAELSSMLGDVSFVLIGPDHVARKRLPTRDNLHLLGARPTSTVPAYLQHADVGLIPFDVAGYPDLVNSVQPLKLFEYLASGLPVVAARWAELERLASPAALYNTSGEAAERIRKAIDEPPSRDVGIRWVQGAGWPARLDPILRTLGLPGVLEAA
jgi:glycosyltransferase involved in cell wall biosynthesis